MNFGMKYCLYYYCLYIYGNIWLFLGFWWGNNSYWGIRVRYCWLNEGFYVRGGGIYRGEGKVDKGFFNILYISYEY